ncbi:Putative NAC domain-containing protein 61, partial [Striga hermonthica]
FYPTEEELVSFYLQNKLKGARTDIERLIPVVDIYDYNPWDLPQLAGEECPADLEQWFFFTPRQERETRGGRPNRLTAKGYWKATGSPNDIYSSQNNRRIGRRKTMVFYEGRAPNGKKTAWKMNEYKLFDSGALELSGSSSSAGSNLQLREEISLCRIYKRTKCLRAFDRRPPEAGVGRQLENNPRHHVVVDELVINNTTSSLSGDAITGIINPSQSYMESDNSAYWDMAVDDDQSLPVWDWDEFNCFDLWN